MCFSVNCITIKKNCFKETRLFVFICQHIDTGVDGVNRTISEVCTLTVTRSKCLKCFKCCISLIIKTSHILKDFFCEQTVLHGQCLEANLYGLHFRSDGIINNSEMGDGNTVVSSVHEASSLSVVSPR